MARARRLRDRSRVYRGSITEPERWEHFQPRKGDVILVTPAKSGTTWTQSMIFMLLSGTTSLPEKLGVMSPWIDSNFGSLQADLDALDRQSGRRVIKTHTPPEGWPVWKDVPVVACFRHPLEVFLSIRKHLANSKTIDEHPLLAPIEEALPVYLYEAFSEDEVDRDLLETIARFFVDIVLSDRLPEKLILNYAGIARDHEGTVRSLDRFLKTGASNQLIDDIVEATGFETMKARAADFAPEASNNLWRDAQKFFAGGRSGDWRNQFTLDQIAAYEARFEVLLPDAEMRHWIETGLGDV